MDLGAVIAYNMKTLRAERNLSLGQLSKITGISKTMLSDMEKGGSNPTINTLWKIAHGFNVPYSRLLDGVESKPSLVTREELLQQSEECTHYRVYFYFNTIPGRNFEIMIGELDPHCEHTTASHGPNAQEYLYLISGKLKVKTELIDVQTLRPTDALSFDSSVEHTYINEGDEMATFLFVNYYP